MQGIILTECISQQHSILFSLAIIYFYITLFKKWRNNYGITVT